MEIMSYAQGLTGQLDEFERIKYVVAALAVERFPYEGLEPGEIDHFAQDIFLLTGFFKFYRLKFLRLGIKFHVAIRIYFAYSFSSLEIKSIEGVPPKRG